MSGKTMEIPTLGTALRAIAAVEGKLHPPPRVKWPRLYRAVERYCADDDRIAARVLLKAAQGDELYLGIIRFAIARRHKRKRR